MYERERDTEEKKRFIHILYVYTLDLSVACIYGVKHLVYFRFILSEFEDKRETSRCGKFQKRTESAYHIHFENCFVVCLLCVSSYEDLKKINKSYRLQPNITIEKKLCIVEL